MIILFVYLAERWAFRSQTGEVTLFLCYQRTGGRCSKSEVQVLIGHGRPVSFNALEMIQENIGKRYCQKYIMFVDQSVGKINANSMVFLFFV